MWWFVCKKSEDENYIIYTYGCETREQTGEISYDRKNEEFKVIKLAKDDNEYGASRLLPHIYRMIFRENCPDEKLIAIG